MERARVGDIMKRGIVTIGVGERMSTVEDIMTLGGVRHLPVVSGGCLVGVISERDLLRASLANPDDDAGEDRRAFLDTLAVARVMSAPAIVIDPKESVRQAALSMATHRIGCLPVIDDRGALVGLVTETDLLRHMAGVGALG
jgi:CBS domain-containing protein